MKIRLLLATVAVAAFAMIIPSGHAAASVCGGMAPREVDCSVEGFVITTDNPNMVVTTRNFIGVVDAEMTGPAGSSTITCVYSLDPLYDGFIRNACHTRKLGTILKGDTVNIEAKVSGRPGQIPALGTWSVLYSAS